MQLVRYAFLFFDAVRYAVYWFDLVLFLDLMIQDVEPGQDQVHGVGIWTDQ